MSPDFDPWSLLKNAWVVITGILIWVFKRHVDEDDKRATALALVERQYATRDQMDELTQTVNENHQEILKILLRD
jgi:hypothetical protein